MGREHSRIMTNTKPNWKVQVDGGGRLVIPSEVLTRYGLKPGAEICFDEATNELRLRRPITHLAKVYIEPTNYCNLDCRFCMRKGWDEPIGQMAKGTFARIVEGLRSFLPPPLVFFGGFGEPLAHPQIVDMVTQIKGLGGSVELITNGTMLSPDLSQQLISAGLDMLWVSLDGATAESYADVRLGATLPEVLANLTRFRQARWGRDLDLLTPQLGIEFVAMRRNIHDLPAVLHLGNRLGAKRFLVSNILPYTYEMCREVLYSLALSDICYLPSMRNPRLDLPKMDINEITREPLYRVLRGGVNGSFSSNDAGVAENRCPFIEGGATAISWEGNLSPCLSLMHNYVSFLNERERFSRRFVVGNINEVDLPGLWNSPDYVGFRERVQAFGFSPCSVCGGCEYSKGNEEDCFGNTFPTCGGCLWAQGVIRCP